MQHRAPRPLADAWRRVPRAAARGIGVAAGRAPARALTALVAVLALGAGGVGVVVSMSDQDPTPVADPPVAPSPRSGSPTSAAEPRRAHDGGHDRPSGTTTPSSRPSAEPSPSEDPSPTRPTQSAAPTTSSAGSTAPSPRPVAPRVEPDDTAPQTTLAADYPAADAATFSFSADEGSSFTCSLDGAAFTSCTSAVEYAEMDPGWHTFAVRATDAAGNVDASPARTRWQANRGDSGGD